jgi:hypothetical protein
VSGICVGARVRDISGHSELLGLSEPGEGVIVTPTEGWTVKWDNPIIGSLNWSDEQLELVQPDTSSQAEIERLRKALKAILKEAHKGKPDPDKIYATAETALSGSKE